MHTITTEREPGQQSPARSRALRALFIGPQGIRSGWSMLIFLAILMAQILVTRVPVNHLLHYMHDKQDLQVWSAIVSLGILASLVLVATAIMAKIEKRPVLSYGFMGERRLSRFVLGIAAGVVALSALVLALKISGYLVFDGQALHGKSAWSYGLQWGLAFLLTGLFEESLSRLSAVHPDARHRILVGSPAALARFGVTHLPNHGESPIGILAVVAVGLVFCLSLWLTKSLYWAVGLHTGWDWAQSYIYGVPNSGQVASGHLFATHPAGGLLWSGGPTGPEGSIYVIPTLALIALGIWIARNQSVQPEEPAVVTVASP